MKALWEEKCSDNIVCTVTNNKHQVEVTVIQESSEEGLSKHGSNGI